MAMEAQQFILENSEVATPPPSLRDEPSMKMLTSLSAGADKSKGAVPTSPSPEPSSTDQFRSSSMEPVRSKKNKGGKKQGAPEKRSSESVSNAEKMAGLMSTSSHK